MISDRIKEYLERQVRARALWPTHVEYIATWAKDSDTALQANRAALCELRRILVPGEEIQIVGTFTQYLHAAMLQHFDYRCAECNVPLKVTPWPNGARMENMPFALEYHVDHVHPRSKEGANNHTNYVPLCPPCNLKKGARL